MSHRSGGAGAAGRSSALRIGALFGSAILLGHVGQFAWLVAGSRAMSLDAFAAVLAAQALYGTLQLIVDTGSGFHGARLAASGTLDDDTRGSLTRSRLQLSLVFAGVMLAVGTLGSSPTLAASAPFAGALVLFALLNYWEPFGKGDARPWSAYVVLRACAPAAAVAAYLAAGESFPVALAGLIECAVLVFVGLVFRLRPLAAARLALRAGRGPWRSMVFVGLPPLLLQSALACGPVVMNAAGRASTAAALAVGARILTGLNQLSSLVATSLFPQLATRGEAGADGNERAAPHGRSVSFGLRIVLLVTLAANAVFLVWPAAIVSLLLARRSAEAEAITALMLSTAAAVGYLTFVAMVLVALRRERLSFAPFALATAVTAVAVFLLALRPPADVGLWAASAVAGAQCLAVIWLVCRNAVLRPYRPAVSVGAAAALGLAGAGAVAAWAPSTRGTLAAVLVLAATALCLWIARGAVGFGGRRP